MSQSPQKPDEPPSSRRETIAIYAMLFGPVIGCLILGVLLRLITWSAISIIIQVTTVIVLVGVVCGIFFEWLIGRRKNFWSNLAGVLLIVAVATLVTLLPHEWTMAVYYDKEATRISGWASTLGTVIYWFSIGGAVRLGGYVGRRVRVIRQRKPQ